MNRGDETLVYSPEEARILLNCSRSVIYDSLRRNIIPHIKLGRKYLIPKFRFHRWLEEEQRSLPTLGINE